MARAWTASGEFPSAKQFSAAATAPGWTADGAAKFGKRFSAAAAAPGWTADGAASIGSAWLGTVMQAPWTAAGHKIHASKWSGAAAGGAWTASGTIPPHNLRVAAHARWGLWSAAGRAQQAKAWDGSARGSAWTARGSASWRGEFAAAARWEAWTATGACAAVTPNSITFCVNTETFGVTQWKDFPFIALGTADGVPFGATADGVYKLAGEDDAGALIDLAFLSGQSLLGDGRLKLVPVVHGDLDGKARIIVEVDGKRYDYHFGNRALLPKGLLGKRWAFGLKNVGGAAVTLRSLEPLITVLSRWVK